MNPYRDAPRAEQARTTSERAGLDLAWTLFLAVAPFALVAFGAARGEGRLVARCASAVVAFGATTALVFAAIAWGLAACSSNRYEPFVARARRRFARAAIVFALSAFASVVVFTR